MLKEGTIPIVDQPLIQAVKYALDQLGVNPDTLPKKKRRTCLDGVGNGGDSSYNGYFTIKLRTLGDGTQTIVVCDGATYDAEKGTSGVSICYVNDTIFRVDSTELSPITDVNTRYVVLKYTPMDYSEGADNSMYGVAVYDMLYEDIKASKSPCYIIGQYTIEDGEITVIQRHAVERYQSKYASNGIIYIEYIVECF